jgi:hypothetical protein
MMPCFCSSGSISGSGTFGREVEFCQQALQGVRTTGICVSPPHNAIHNISIPEIGCLAAISAWFCDSGKMPGSGPKIEAPRARNSAILIAPRLAATNAWVGMRRHRLIVSKTKFARPPGMMAEAN